MLLDTITGPESLKGLTVDQLTLLSQEIREVLIRKISVTGGHLSSNLGVVELTVALHTVFDCPRDKIVFDVSHQCYTHKLLTGRKAAFLEESRYEETTGFSNPEESEADLFHMGHTSTSVSLACGLAKARDILGTGENVIAVIGDAALDGGEALEGLNYAKELGSGLIIVINDNDMSIPENYGALKDILNELNEKNGSVSPNFFTLMGFDYHFVKDGHDLTQLISCFAQVKDTTKPVIVHCRTVKGKGYPPAEADSERYHWSHPFDVASGVIHSRVPKENYGAIVGEYLLEKMAGDPKVTLLTASMPMCVGFQAQRRQRAGGQLVDVGIAEQHGLSMAAAMARRGIKAVFATNSTFYQRAFDQIQQELCLTSCPVTMLISNTGVHGHVNVTHVGLYDIALFSHLDNLVFLAPTCKEEYLSMLDWSIEQQDRPVMIRIPWSGVYHSERPLPERYDTTRYRVDVQGREVALLALGSFYQLGEKAVELLEKEGLRPTLINPLFASGLDRETLDDLTADHRWVVTLEDGVLEGGFGSKIAQYYCGTGVRVLNRGIGKPIPIKYEPAQLLRANHLTAEQLAEDILEVLDPKHSEKEIKQP